VKETVIIAAQLAERKGQLAFLPMLLYAMVFQAMLFQTTLFHTNTKEKFQ
jgi:hypothetical protein